MRPSRQNCMQLKRRGWDEESTEQVVNATATHMVGGSNGGSARVKSTAWLMQIFFLQELSSASHPHIAQHIESFLCPHHFATAMENVGGEDIEVGGRA